MSTRPTRGRPVVELLSTTDLSTITPRVLFLERYSHDELKTLPPTLREALLINLPVADICSLQQTDVVLGLDMDYIWKTIVSFRTPPDLVKLTSSPLSRFSTGNYELFMELISSVLLNRNTFNAAGYESYGALLRDLLFSLKGAPIVEQWRAALEEDASLFPALKTGLHPVGPYSASVPASRYMQYYEKHVSDAEFSEIIHDKCHYSVSQVNVHAPYFACQTLHDTTPSPTKCESFSLLQPFHLLKYKSLWFVADDEDQRTSLKTLFLAMREVTKSQDSVLKNVCIHAGSAPSLQAHIEAISPFFSTQSATKFRHHAKHPTALHLYTGLNEIMLSTDNSQSRSPPSSPDIFASLISSQENLSRLSLIGTCLLLAPHKMRRVTSALVNFMHRPAMEGLNIVDLSLPFFLFQLIMGSYFSKTSHTHNQVLYFDMVKICNTDRPFYTSTNAQTMTNRNSICMNEKQLKYCSLQFRSTYLDQQVLSWLLSPTFHLCFNTLDFHAINFQVDSVDLLGMLAAHPALQVKHLFLTSLQLPLTENTTEDLQRLLSKESLKFLTIAWCTIGGGRIFTLLTQALIKQVVQPEKPTSVKSLSVMASRLGREQAEDVKLFFVALRMQKTVDQLRLDLRRNELTPQHFELLCDVWSSFDTPRKLRLLSCGGNELPEDVSCLDSVAKKVCLN